MFQFTFPYRERYCCSKAFEQTGFQFTLPYRERFWLMQLWIWLMKFQFTFPCRERSSHLADIKHLERFNSRSHTGSDAVPIIFKKYLWRFNSRSHEGSELVTQTPSPIMLCFNSRSYVGSNMFMWLICISSYKFQFTLPRRERCLALVSSPHTFARFNSRSHVGSDTCACSTVFTPSFQLTLPRRERLVLSFKNPATSEFQFTLPRRERFVVIHCLSSKTSSFNSRAHNIVLSKNI